MMIKIIIFEFLGLEFGQMDILVFFVSKETNLSWYTEQFNLYYSICCFVRSFFLIFLQFSKLCEYFLHSFRHLIDSYLDQTLIEPEQILQPKCQNSKLSTYLQRSITSIDKYFINYGVLKQRGFKQCGLLQRDYLFGPKICDFIVEDPLNELKCKKNCNFKCVFGQLHDYFKD